MLSAVEIDIIVKIVIAALLGGLVGLEREIHKKPGGLRMHALVCMGATLFTIISLYFSGPSIAAGIVTGLGFLGAGLIFKGDNYVHGLTTAAEIWVIGAIGIAIGVGFYAIAVVTTIIVLIILGPLKMFEKQALSRKKK